MELGKIFGLPAHPLVVHIPIALIPLCAIGAVVMVISPRWRQRIGWVVVGLAGIAVVASQLAVGSGQALEDALDEQSALLERHAELGETFVWFALVFFLALLALMIWDTKQRRKTAAAEDQADRKGVSRSTAGVILSVLVVLTGVGASYRVYQVGHSGAKAVWLGDASAFDETSGG